MANNAVAANLLMLVLIVGGVVSALGLKQEVFPEFDLDKIQVRVVYPGASPDEVEQGIILAVEEAVRGLDGVKRVDATAREGLGIVTIDLLLGTDADNVLADVKSEVDRITTLPLDAEEPEVILQSRRQEVISFVLAGAFGAEKGKALSADDTESLRTLHDLAERARRELLALDGVTQVELSGVPPLEVSIEISRERLEELGLDLQQVANEVGAASLELPGGGLDTASGEVLVRVADRRRTGSELADVVLRRTATGAEIRLGDIAQIHDGYEDIDQYSVYNGKPAIRVTAYRVGDETPTSVADAVRDYVDELRGKIPDSVELAVWKDDSEALRDRIDLLLRNAAMGLALVVLVLALFLDLRLAFWVGLGIPISFMGAMLILGPAGVSLNMVSLFAFIVTLGMVVDDAIVVGERTFARREEGLSPMKAAVSAAREMSVPVTFAILTTVAAFAPLFFVPGTMGKIFRIIPAVVISVLLLSLLESFFILPAHLAHSKRHDPNEAPGLVARGQSAIARGLDVFIRRIYQPIVRFAVAYRYATVAFALATAIVTGGYVASGGLAFNFFPTLEGDVARAEVKLPYGTAVETTEAVRRQLEDAANATIAEYGGDAILRGVFTKVGEAAQQRGPGAGEPESGSHIVSVEVNLVPNDQRSFKAEDFSNSWQSRLPPIVGVESITFDAASGPSAGAAVAVQLKHTDGDRLIAASRKMQQVLRSYDELKNVRSSYADGKPQIDFHLRPEARASNLTAREVARQIRASFYGAEALREQRGRNEVKIVARLPANERASERDLTDLLIRTPAGAYVPLPYVADAERGRAATSIQREDGSRTVEVSAELAAGVDSPRRVLTNLKDKAFVELQAEYPGLQIATVGAQREQAEAFASLGRNYVVAMFVIFALLAVPFRSYIQPVVIMCVIPFGIVGAVWGHMILGYGLSIMSMFGIVALSGVVVNDSIVLIDAANRLRREGASPQEAIIQGGMTRLRPILLTSLTTFFGLIPIIAETSVQAQFLIPMAISLGFGVLFATAIVLLIVPAVYAIVEDARGLGAAAAPPAE
jgi:multidrug efflux pump subunit AcrB